MKRQYSTAETPRRIESTKGRSKWTLLGFVGFSLCLCASVGNILAQEMPPEPSAPKSVTIPAVKESKLRNGLTVAVIERSNVPLVTVQLLVKRGASSETLNKAGLANLTASMLTKGTKTRTATQIAEEMEFLGGSINTGAGWNNSIVNVTVTSDKVEKAMEILSDVVRNPSFKDDELELLKSQELDGLTYNLKQPGFLATYVASKYSFGEHPAGGTPASLKAINRSDVSGFHLINYQPGLAVLVFAGDISQARATALAHKFFGEWTGPSTATATSAIGNPAASARSAEPFKRILVVDLPNSGQAAVTYRRSIGSVGRRDKVYYPSSVLNSLLGGGYSSRLNQEIRIRRGLSYGAGSNFSWRNTKTNFSASTQTKNESAAEVTQLVLAEIKRLTEGEIAASELTPRKSVLTGNFGRNLETTGGLAGAVGDLYSFEIPPSELNAYVNNVNAVSDAQIREFAAANLFGGDIIIVGDYSIFREDLAKRFPNVKVYVIKADELDLSKDVLP